MYRDLGREYASFDRVLIRPGADGPYTDERGRVMDVGGIIEGPGNWNLGLYDRAFLRSADPEFRRLSTQNMVRNRHFLGRSVRGDTLDGVPVEAIGAMGCLVLRPMQGRLCTRRTDDRRSACDDRPRLAKSALSTNEAQNPVASRHGWSTLASILRRSSW